METLAGGRELTDWVNEFLDNDKINIIIDFSEVSEVRSSGLGAIASAYKKIKSKSGNLKIIGVQKDVAQAFKAVRLSGIIEIHLKS